MAKVAWIGIGVMGSSMVKHLLKGGHCVTMYNKTIAKAEKVKAEAGGEVVDSVKKAVKDADFIFTMIGYPKDVEDVYLGSEGIFACAKKGAIAIDMTTSQPALAKKLYDAGRKASIRVLDAPVSGGDMGARNATLSIMVGGDEKDFNEVKPLFELMGKNIVHLGSAGYGQHTKAANQIAVAGATAAMTEALVYSKKVGLDPEKMLQAIGAGAAGSWQLANMAPRVLKRDLAPGFFIKHFIKDMKIVQEEMAARGTDLGMLNAVLGLYLKMAESGFENDGTQALIKLYEKA
jgi:3-hydroxyisobutyrate dehydrogenase-like beta-hydroxyacid dehydrogenase